MKTCNDRLVNPDAPAYGLKDSYLSALPIISEHEISKYLDINWWAKVDYVIIGLFALCAIGSSIANQFIGDINPYVNLILFYGRLGFFLLLYIWRIVLCFKVENIFDIRGILALAALVPSFAYYRLGSITPTFYKENRDSLIGTFGEV